MKCVGFWLSWRSDCIIDTNPSVSCNSHIILWPLTAQFKRGELIDANNLFKNEYFYTARFLNSLFYRIKWKIKNLRARLGKFLMLNSRTLGGGTMCLSIGW